MCIYQFTCSCGAGYIGRTKRALSKRISEHHHPTWLCKGLQKSVKSSILEHLVYPGRSASPELYMEKLARYKCRWTTCVRQILLLFTNLSLTFSYKNNMFSPSPLTSLSIFYDLSFSLFHCSYSFPIIFRTN